MDNVYSKVEKISKGAKSVKGQKFGQSDYYLRVVR